MLADGTSSVSDGDLRESRLAQFLLAHTAQGRNGRQKLHCH